MQIYFRDLTNGHENNNLKLNSIKLEKVYSDFKRLHENIVATF
jgi:hypothetical protein